MREAQRGRWGPCLGKIPIFVSLRQYAETGKSLLDFIVDEFAVCGFPDARPFVEALLQAGKALVLFDGLDEVGKTDEADRRGQVTEALAQFARQYGDCHIVITCRIAATEYTFQPAFTYVEMADFAPDQVEKFVRAWFWDDAAADKGVPLAEKMLAEWERPEHAGIRDLGRNPLLLTLLCLAYAETLSFPARRVEIYEEALDALLKKWDSTRQIQRGSRYKQVSLGRKRQMFSRIAYNAFARGEIVFRQADLEGWLVDYLAHVPELPQAIDIDGEAVLKEIVAQHGIFVEQAHGLYSFAHLTFQEYYAACYIAADPATALDTLLNHVADPKWREVGLLTFSLFDDATPFLAAFERALQRLIAQRLQLVAWLRWIDEQTGVSQAAYRPPAIRCWYARALASDFDFEHDVARDRARVFDLYFACNRACDRAHALARALDLNLALALVLARDFDLARDLALDLAPDLVVSRALDLVLAVGLQATLQQMQASGWQKDQTALARALAALEIPSTDAPPATWKKFAAQLDEIINVHDALGCYHRLEAEAADLTKAAKELWPLDENDLEAFVAYLDATQLFYDCLQLAYTSDRTAFEDRILLLPPEV